MACLTYAIVLYTYCLRSRVYKEGEFNRLDDTMESLIRGTVNYTAIPLLNLFWMLLNPRAALAQNSHFSDLQRMRPGDPSHEEADGALFNILLALSDQQLFTGFAVLMVAYIQMEYITAYHAAIIECMATMSFVVYESTSTIMVAHLKGKDVERRFKPFWRGVVILSFMALLLATQVPLGNRHWLDVYGMPYKCFWQRTSGNYSPDNAQNLASMLVHIFWLFWGMLRTFDDYFPDVFEGFFLARAFKWLGTLFVKLLLRPRWLYHYSSDASKDKNTNETIRLALRVPQAFSYLVAVFVFILAEILDSEAFNLQGNWFLILNSIYWSFTYRHRAVHEGRIGDESKWGFGQAVPVFLLALPVVALIEAIYGTHIRLPSSSCVCGTWFTDISDPDAWHSRNDPPKSPSKARAFASSQTTTKATCRNWLPNTTCFRQKPSRDYNKDYYWGCGVENVNTPVRLWEEELYEQWLFKLALLTVLLAFFGVWTYLALRL